MAQPPGFVVEGGYEKVFHLKKFLYSLKQGPQDWFGKFSEVDLEFGLKKSKCDSVFYKQSAAIILLVVYIDDIVITGDDCAGISSIKSFLHTNFPKKDLNQLKYFLGVEVTRSTNGRIFLSRRNYVLDLLGGTRNMGAKPCRTQMVPNAHLTKDDGDPSDDLEK